MTCTPQGAHLTEVLLVQFAYKCSDGGGWHDFFAYQDHLVPWSPAKERAGGEECIRLNFRGVDDVLHLNLHAGWEPYNAAGVSQVPFLSIRTTVNFVLVQKVLANAVCRQGGRFVYSHK